MFSLAVICILLFRFGDSLPKGATCNFSWDWDSIPGHRLPGYEIDVKHGVSLLQCVRACLDLDSRVCRSINYNRVKRECQLNGFDVRIKPGRMSAESGWIYYHKRVSSPERIAGYKGDHCYVDKCPPNTNPYKDICIEINSDPFDDFLQGKIHCEEKYGKLIEIKDQAKWNHLVSLPLPYRYFVGFTRNKAGKLQWGDKTLVETKPENDICFFLPDQPDDFNNADGAEDCGGLEYSKNVIGLNDVPCSIDWGNVCEYDKWVYSLW